MRWRVYIVFCLVIFVSALAKFMPGFLLGVIGALLILTADARDRLP